MSDPSYSSLEQNIALSICIPTYNFGEFIGETLDSIVGQLTDEVEIVIVDGASTDETPEVVRRYSERLPGIKYHRLPAKGGIDRDMAKAVALARGSYCWLFSSDDIMKPGAISKVLELVASGSDLYLCTHTACTLDMKYLTDYPVLASAEAATFDLRRGAERSRYFGLAETTEAFFSFMSGLVVKKSRWDAVPLNEHFVGSCWAHVARLCELMQAPQAISVTFVPRPLLDRRGDNDSFAGNSVVRRHAIAIEGYHKIADTFFGLDSHEASHIRRVVRNEYGFRMLLDARMRCELNPQVENKTLLDQLVRKAYRDLPVKSLLIRCAFNVIPARWYAWLQKRYRRIRYESA
jgi:abequosyltransferase